MFYPDLSFVAGDMDSSGVALIGSHGYCCQEVVNLFLFGSAVSNTFDGDVTLGESGDDVTVLRGVPKKSDIGLLSLFEHYKSVTVGDRLKSPVFPVWVVCSESHFTVLYCISQDPRRSPVVRLSYYDQLGRQDRVIQLTLTVEASGDSEAGTGLESPLEHCIRTKWPDAHIVWENCEPLL